jgi:cysteine desulfurase family protein
LGIFYFDNAASSWPKPEAVAKEMSKCINEYAANPGRGSHQMAVRANRIILETRRSIAKLFGVRNPNDISFSLNTTAALNLALKGFLKQGDHVICTSIEHNSVRRPLEYLKDKIGIEITYLKSDKQGHISLDEINKMIRTSTTLIVINHSSNVLGTIIPIESIAEIARPKGIKILVDAAQSAGVLQIDVDKQGIDMMAFPGHKGLLGPQGTGGLYIHPTLDLQPMLQGGTGSQSEDIEQPLTRPERYEAGTQNTVGLAGLNEGVKFILNEKVENIHNKEWNLIQRLMEGLLKINDLQLYGPELGEERTGILSFNIKGIDPAEVAFILDQSFNIAVRAGFHCAPLAHKTAETLDTGAIRASIGIFTTNDEIDHFINAITEIKKHYH